MPEQKNIISRRDFVFKVIPAALLGLSGAGALIKGAELLGRNTAIDSIGRNVQEIDAFVKEMDIKTSLERTVSALKQRGFVHPDNIPYFAFFNEELRELEMIRRGLREDQSLDTDALQALAFASEGKKNSFRGTHTKEYRQKYETASLEIIHAYPTLLTPKRETVLMNVAETILGQSRGAVLQRVGLREHTNFQVSSGLSTADRKTRKIHLDPWEFPFALSQAILPHEIMHLLIGFSGSYKEVPIFLGAISHGMLLQMFEYLPEIMKEIVEKKIDYGSYQLAGLQQYFRDLTISDAGGLENYNLVKDDFEPLLDNPSKLPDIFTQYQAFNGKLKGTKIGETIEDGLCTICDEVLAQSLPLSVLGVLPDSSPRAGMLKAILYDINPNQSKETILSSLRRLMAMDLETSLPLFPDEAKSVLQQLVKVFFIRDEKELLLDEKTKHLVDIVYIKYPSLLGGIDFGNFHAIYHFPEPGLRDRIFTAIFGEEEWHKIQNDERFKIPKEPQQLVMRDKNKGRDDLLVRLQSGPTGSSV